MAQQAASAPELRSLYRRVLRELPSRPISSPSLIQKRLRSQFEQSDAPPNEANLDAMNQMTQYLHAQRMYTTLVERYNPGMNMDEEERTRLTARRVGMELPKELQAVFGGGSGGSGRDGQGGEGKS